jgi:hypothetical protein
MKSPRCIVFIGTLREATRSNRTISNDQQRGYGITQKCACQETLKSVAVVLQRSDDDCVSYVMNYTENVEDAQRYSGFRPSKKTDLMIKNEMIELQKSP